MNAAIESLVEARGGRGYVPYDAVVVAANLLANVVMFAPEHQDGPASNAQRTVEVLGEVARLLANMPVLAVLPGGVK